MPYHLSTLLGSRIVHSEAFMTRMEAQQTAKKRAQRLAEENLRREEQQVERLRRAVLDLDQDDRVPQFPLVPPSYSHRVHRCSNPQLCVACFEAGFDKPERWPRRGSAWDVFDRGTHIELLRHPDTQAFNDDEEAAAFVVFAIQSSGTPEAVRRECQLALGEILYCNSLGIEAWRITYGQSGKSREILDSQEDEDVPCECQGSGFLVMNEDRYEPEEALGEIQACDCGIFKTDDEAITAARSAGYSVNDEGLIFSEPSRLPARRRYGI